MRSTISTLLIMAPLMALTADRVVAQQRSIPVGATEAEIVAHAEAEGAAYPRVPAPPIFRALFAPEQKGTAERRCVEGIELGPVRSGEFVIGGNLGGSRAMRAGVGGKVWWAPLHHALDMPPLEVRGRSLTSAADTLRYTTDNVAWPTSPSVPAALQTYREYFFPSGINVPRSGRWLLIATSGNNWGCFILSVR